MENDVTLNIFGTAFFLVNQLEVFNVWTVVKRTLSP